MRNRAVLLVLAACSGAPEERAASGPGDPPPDPCALGPAESLTREAGQLLGSPLLVGRFDPGPSHFWHVAQEGEGGWIRVDWYRPDSLHWVAIPSSGEPVVYEVQPYRVCAMGGLFAPASRLGDPDRRTVLLPRPPVRGRAAGTQRVLWRAADGSWRESAEVAWVEDPPAGAGGPEPAELAAVSPGAALPTEQETGPAFDLRASIQDPDGFTNVRSIPSTDGEVVARVYQGEVFRTFRQEGGWWRVRTGGGVIGFMHVSRIRLLDGSL